MRLAYVTTFEVSDISTWTKTDYKLGTWGAGYHIAKTLESQDISLDYVQILDRTYEHILVRYLVRYKSKFYSKFSRRDYATWAEPIIIRDYASQISSRLSSLNSDIILFVENQSIFSLAYFKSKQPVVVWTDTSLAGLIDFYFKPFDNFCNETKKNIYAMEKAGLDSCNLILFSSDWAAQTAIKTYGIEPSKVRVVPWGANIECNRTDEDVKSIVESRTTTPCKLLFMGVDWYRKGGDIAVEVAKELNKMGLNTELLIAGTQPITNEPLPSFVKTIGLIDKYTDEGINKMNQLFCESHFLIMPSRADCSPIVLAEANSFGLPCLTTNVGGIPTIIKEGLNGRTFSLKANILEYCTYITSLMGNYSEYKRLARSSFHEYQSRLNWAVAGKTAKQLITEMV
jgi:glycosyltransferase involved in cell wall biosynthesis